MEINGEKCMCKLTEIWRNLRVRTKVQLILLLAIALVSATAMTTLRIPMKAYDERLYQSSSQMITLFADQIQSDLQNFEAISYRILTDNALQKNLSIMETASPGTVAWVDAQNEVGSRVAYFSLWFSDAVCFQLKTSGGRTYSQFFGSSVSSDRLTPELVEYASGRLGNLVWLTQDSEQPQLILLREIREMDSLRLNTLGTMLIEVDFPALVEKYRRGMTQMGSPLSCAVYSGDVCLYATNDAVRSLPAGEDGYNYMKLEGEEVLCVRYTAPNGMKYVTTVDYSRIASTISAATSITMAVILAAAILAVFVSALLMNSILRHLQILLNKFDDFARRGRPVFWADSPYRSRQDEIGQLHRHFDRMTRAWDHMTREKEEQQRLLQETRMQQLRAQVRPHFLYNTLESIYCLAQSAPDKRIAEMTDALGKMLRASLNESRDVVTIAEDLQVTREYLRIQLIRYGERLQVEYQMDPAILDCAIPSMTIQPLVENAVHHAAEEMLDTCIIRIRGKASDEGVEVSVEDNGPGMDEDILAKLESGEVQPEGLGIGMRNIHKRVQYAFSDRYGLQVKCQDGWTRIIVHLPEKRL